MFIERNARERRHTLQYWLQLHVRGSRYRVYHAHGSPCRPTLDGHDHLSWYDHLAIFPTAYYVLIVLCWLYCTIQGLGEVYALVMRQCQERQAADVMRLALEERRDAGGNLAPDRHAYASTLGCFGKVIIVLHTCNLATPDRRGAEVFRLVVLLPMLLLCFLLWIESGCVPL